MNVWLSMQLHKLVPKGLKKPVSYRTSKQNNEINVF